MDQLDEFLLGHLIQPTSLQTRIDKGIEPDRGDRARLASGDIAEKVADDTLGEAIGFDLVCQGKCRKRWCLSPVSTNDAFDHALVAKVIDPPGFAVAHASSIDQGQIAGSPGFEKTRFQSNGELLRDAGS